MHTKFQWDIFHTHSDGYSQNVNNKSVGKDWNTRAQCCAFVVESGVAA